MPTEPERPKRATFYPATGMTLVDADALPEDAPRCPRSDCGVTLAFVPAGGCGKDGCPYEDETERQYVERLAS